jgi:hypothetical protein
VLGFRFFACDRCETVYASPAAPAVCDRCDGGRLTDITDTLRNDAYFAPVD